jgi:hypothetical protein
MRPDVHGFVVGHEQRLEDFLWSVEVYAVAASDVYIIFDVWWGVVDCADIRLLRVVSRHGSRRGSGG